VITFRPTRVVSFSLQYLDVYWEVEPTTEDLQEYDFYVERSEAEYGPWQPVAGPLVDRYYLRDNNVPLLSANRLLFYRVRAVRRDTGTEVTAPAASRMGNLPLDAVEIVRLEELVAREHSGTLAWIFPRKTFGQRCPQCWDRALGKVTDDQCPTCWATGFSGGYHYPVEAWVGISPPPKVENIGAELHTQANTVSLAMGNSPLLSPYDLIIDHLNRRWRVLNVSTTARYGITVRQTAQCTRVMKGSVEDAIPLQVDLASLEVSARRSYTNPHVPGQARTDMATLLGTYGVRG